MHIEFQTANGAMVREISIDVLKKELNAWCSKRNQMLLKHGYVSPCRYLVWFDEEHDNKVYTLFALTWNPNNKFFKRYVVKKV